MSGQVVFDKNRYAVQRPAWSPGLALPVEFPGNGECIRIEFNDRVESRPVLVDFLDAGEIRFNQRTGCKSARLHSYLEVSSCGLFELEILRGRHLPTGERRGAHRSHCPAENASLQ